MSTADSASGLRVASEGTAVLFDLNGWTVLTLRRRDAAKFLHSFCTADIKKLAVGEGCEAFLTNVKARVVGHAFVFADEDAGGAFFTLVGSPGQGPKLSAHLDRYLITEQVAIADETEATGLLFVSGPGAMARLTAIGIDPPPGSSEAGRMKSQSGVIAGTSCRVRATAGCALPGFLIEAPGSEVATVREQLMATGVTAGTSDAFETFRVESAFPLYDIDVSEDHLAPEVGRPWAISYTKGCYLGQEPIARIDALGHVNRLLRGLRLESETLPERSARVSVEGKEIGAVTSAVAGCDGRAVALAYLRAKFAGAGTGVTVGTAEGEGEVPASVYLVPAVL